MVDVAFVVALLTLIFTILAYRATQRPSEADREEALNRRLGNEFGPGSGRYEGSKHVLDIVNVEVDEQSDIIYRFLRYFTGGFQGITNIVVRLNEDTAPDSSRIESQLSILGRDSEVLKVDVTDDEITYVIGSTDPRKVQNLFDDLRKALDQFLIECNK